MYLCKKDYGDVNRIYRFKSKNNRKHININSLIFNKKIYSEGPKIVVIGSGNGLETVVRGLKQYTDNITAVVTVSSYGNMKKESINSMPIEDIKNTVIALVGMKN